ncbi:MAG: malate:quinone oxidoreductase, partial [Helicobacter sp.]|nr:malate:quinone oxidoreductase [Helicobacter sp.]
TCPFYKNMIFTQDRDEIAEFAPLLMQGRDTSQNLALTLMKSGSDVDFGAITRGLCRSLQKNGVNVFTQHKVTDLKKQDAYWELTIKDKASGSIKKAKARFVFIGAGGGAFPLLQKSGIRESRGYAGFPVNGLWLVCKNQEVINLHSTKVYGKASVGDPPMSVPHLDTRFIDGNKELMFGPFASFNTRFLKSGSLLDFPLSVRFDNLLPMIQAGLDNISLTTYLIKQVFLSKSGRVERLRSFFPQAQSEDWEVQVAGQRVQIIKKDSSGRGSLQFGTEVIASQDGTLSAILGASPGASTSVDIILEILESCFSKEMALPQWQEKIAQMVPSYRNTLEENIARFNELRSKPANTLGLVFESI